MRSGRGLIVEKCYAGWEPLSPHDQSSFEVSRLSADSVVTFTFSHEDLVEKAKHVFLQVACLYTNIYGKKCIRVHTLALSATNAISSTFRYTCIDTLVNLLTKELIVKERTHPNGKQVRANLVEQCVNILHAYRVRVWHQIG